MSKFKIAWRINGYIYANDEVWQSYLRLIDKYDDVADEMALAACDDFFSDLAPLENQQKQIDIMKIRFEDLRKRGCEVGINVWPSLNLYPVERAYYPNMRRMVGIDGEIIEDLACPTSKEFMEHMCAKYTIYAKANPDFIWMDDDLRFTHMSGNYPCFCEDCVKNFKSGAFATREDLVEALEKPENRDLRIAWSSYGADRLAKLCAALRGAVDKINPNIDIGLMTVGASHTTFSGDYIEKCMKAFRSRRGRPGHDCYNDNALSKLMWKSLEAGRQVLEYPKDTTVDILWEEDSHPQGHLLKSFRTRRNEISLALMSGCTGVAFNHLSTNNRVDERLGREVDELHSVRPRWEKFLNFAKDLPWCGMLPYYSWFLTAKADPKYAWLKENPFGELEFFDCDISAPGEIGPYGVALTADSKNACATLFSGKTLTALNDDELKAAFSGNVYMDGSALAALEERGFADLAGVKINPVLLANKPCFVSEHPFNGKFAGDTYRTIHDVQPNTLIPLDDKVEWLGYRKPVADEGEQYYISKYENSLGGKVIVNAYSAWRYTDCPHNLYFFSSMAEWFGSPIRLKWENDSVISRVQPYIRTNGKKAAVMLLNASLDTTNPFEIVVKGEMTKAVLVNPDGSEIALKCHREGESLYASIPEIDVWDIAYVLMD